MVKRIMIQTWIVILCFVLTACKKTPTEPDPTPTPVTIAFDIYNHTQGFLNSYTKSAMTEDTITVTMQELINTYGASGIDPDRLVIRQRGFGAVVGPYSNTGETSFTAATDKTSLDIFLFNASNNAPYNCMEEEDSLLHLGKRDYVVYRQDFDGQDDGPEIIWQNAIDPLNQILKPNGIPYTYGSIQRKPKPNDGTGDFSYGFDDCYGADGYHDVYNNRIAVNWDKNNGAIIFNTNIAIEELFEIITWTDNICGAPSNRIVSSNGTWTEQGKDLITYVFVKE